MSNLRPFIDLLETRADNKLAQEPLPYKVNALSPVMSKETIKYHFGRLAKAYVDRYNKGEGDSEFNRAGAVLHNIFFAQFKEPSSSRPTGTSLEFINRHFKNGFEELKSTFEKTAMAIQGSGWVYLAKNGEVKTIKNHQIKSDIILLIDWWEHAWALDYQHDKQKYLDNIWRIIDWSVINNRLQGV